MFLPALLLILTQFDPFSHIPPAQTGIASQYSQGKIDGNYAWMVNGGIIAEIDWESAVRFDTVGYGIEIEMMPMTSH